jgi:cell wall-associated NlpC family hydrolase
MPGDLLFYANDTSDPSTIHHVAMYAGNGMMVEAPFSGSYVHVTSAEFGNGYIGATRVGT